MSKYTDDIHAATGVINAVDLGRKYQCPVIFFNTHHAHAFGTRDHRSEVRFFQDGERWRSKPIRVREGVSTLKESRQAHLQAAIEWAEKRNLGVEEWVPSGFSNTWIPKVAKERVMADLKAWRKGQRAAVKREA